MDNLNSKQRKEKIMKTLSNKTRFLFFLILILILPLFLLNGKPAFASETWTLKMAMFFPEVGPRWECVAKFVDEVERKTNGKVKFKLFNSQSLCPGTEEYEYVSKGFADSSISLDLFSLGHQPTLGVLNIPTVGNWNFVTPLFKEGLLEMLSKRVEKDNIKMLVPWPTADFGAWPHRSTHHKKIGDWKGSKVWAASGLMKAIVTTLEATPTNIPIADCYTSLQTGVLDGGMWSRSWIQAAKLQEVGPFITLVDSHNEFHAMSFIPLFNMKIWNKFPPEIQKILEDTAWEIHSFSIKAWQKDAEKATKWIKSTNAKVYTAPYSDVRKWTELASRPAWDVFIENGGEFGKQVKDFVVSLQEKYRK
jgi:TRAP-type C4-dicarboxylate transport system substrate-binding protein